MYALRTLVVIELLLLAVLIAVDLHLESKLPTPLQNQILMQDEAMPAAWLLAWVPLMCGYLVSAIGIYRLWRPARALYAGLTLVALLLLPAFGHSVVHAWAVPLHEISSAVTGAILALLYLSPASEHFGATSRESAV